MPWGIPYLFSSPKKVNFIIVMVSLSMIDSLRTWVRRLGKLSFRRVFYAFVIRQDVILTFVLLLLVLILSFSTQTFLTRNNWLNLMRNFAWIALAALGQSMVIITGGIDLSVGAVMALSSVVTAFSLRAGFPVWLSIFLGITVGAAIGLINGFFVAKVRLPAFIATLITMSISRGLVFGWTRGWPVRDFPDSFRALGFDLALGNFLLPISLVVTFVLALLVAFVMNNTVLGTYIFALGNSERAVVVAGVDHVRVKTLVYVMSGMLAAVSGLLLTARLGVAAPTAAEGYELSIIAAAVIGGASLFGGEGGVIGVLLGAAFVQVLNNALVLLGVAANWQTAVIGVATLIALLADYFRRRKILQED